MGEPWKSIKVAMPARQRREFLECVAHDGRSPAEIIRSLVEPWIESRKVQTAVMKSIATSTTNAPATGSSTAAAFPTQITIKNQGTFTPPARPVKEPSKVSRVKAR